ncbi:hypothetical protein BaRGS_00012174 [Batillaria attramentaria]|uniref:Folate receptor-like domain-containing protein n=1 Tax=Batillaria attramentaria TaxID=370345 RepID=A0ABD0LAW7_9CAEN
MRGVADLLLLELLVSTVIWVTVIVNGAEVSYRIRKASSVNELLNTCIDGRNHKSKPGPEASLFGHCLPWKHRSCCTEDVAKGLALDRSWLNFDWHHCGELSPSCAQHFVKDLCFYECSPNLGPWIVPDKRKIRNERMVGVPLCQSACSSWWQDCKHDLTCLDNWAEDFDWSTGINTCPAGKPCKKFENIFGSAQRFCEGLWNNSFKVVSDEEDCFRLWFSADDPNPNDAIARRHAEKLLGQSGTASSIADLRKMIIFSMALYVVSFFLIL